MDTGVDMLSFSSSLPQPCTPERGCRPYRSYRGGEGRGGEGGVWWVKYQINYLRAHKELKASPLKPNVSTLVRSEKSLSFDVWCFKVKASKLCGSTPKPLSLTSKTSAPWFLSLISMFVAPASKLFSTSSFIAVAMLNTTCPEHIWWMDFWSIDWTTGDDETAAILLNIREGSDFSVWSPALTFGPSAWKPLNQIGSQRWRERRKRNRNLWEDPFFWT